MRSGLISAVKLPGTRASGLCDADNSRGRRRGRRRPRRHLANTRELVDFYAGLAKVRRGISVGKFVDAPIRERVRIRRKCGNGRISGE